VIPKEKAEEFKNDYEFYLFKEVSVKNGFNPQEIYIQAAFLLYDDFIECEKNLKVEKEGIKLENRELIRNKIRRKKELCI